MTDRLQTTYDLPIGTDIFYTGDVANIPWWGTIIDTYGNGYAVEHHYQGDDNSPMMTTILLPNQIGTVYQGHCDPRFVTGKAVRTYREACAKELLNALG